MEQNDFELRELLREWKAPDAPLSLESRVLKRTRPWWSVLLHGYIRIPVPVAVCLAILIIGGAWRLTTISTSGCSAAKTASPVMEQASPPVNAYHRPAACAVDSIC
jgi:hypothetical protein